MGFSVLLSIYHKEKEEYFHRCMQSIWTEQTLKPDEIVLVQDGPLNNVLYNAITIWKERLASKLSIIPLEENIGLGDALRIGVDHCSHEIIARMDTDDIADSYRFEKQIYFLKTNPDIDILGTWISEFEKDENIIVSYRKLPLTHQEIAMFLKKRNPLNHPSVMYRKKAVLSAGNYQKMLGFEDYYLWVRMLLNGSRMANIPEPLVKMRTGTAQLKRRGGSFYIKNELLFQQKLLNMGIISHVEFIHNNILRIIVRIMPNNFRSFVYKLIRKKNF